jgi:uncharacterized protein (DUF2141 family)
MYIKTLIGILLFIIQPMLLCQTDSTDNKFGKLTVKVTGFEDDTGNCRFALDNSRAVYESEDDVWIGKVLPIIENQVIVEFDSLKYGEYAVRVFHDKNENEEIDTNVLGIPTEDYGYSNNASAWFGPPSWEKAKFLFDEKELLIEINID